MSNVNKTSTSSKKKNINSLKKNTTNSRSNQAKKETVEKSKIEAQIHQEKKSSKNIEIANEEFVDIKLCDEKKKNVFVKILDIILWIVLISWMLIVVIDYVRTINSKEPLFCIKKDVIEYEDGVVNSCTGLGYKAYEYNRESYQAIEFGPFWIKVRNDDVKK